MTTSIDSGSTPDSSSSTSAACTERSLTCSSSPAMCLPRRPNLSTITASGMPLRSATSAAVMTRSGGTQRSRRARSASLRGVQDCAHDAAELRDDVRRYLTVAPDDPAKADRLSERHQGPRGHFGVDRAELAPVDRLLKRRDVALRHPVVVPLEDLRRDERRLANDPVEPRVLGREFEVPLEAEDLLLDAGRPLLRLLGHRVADAPVQIADELVEDFLLRCEVEVERPLSHARRLGDLHDRGVVEVAEHLLGRGD